MKKPPALHAVMGLGHGDEGKGHTVAHLCTKYKKPIVVRFNGGHQCGHTVYAGEDKHVFRSLGSGTMTGAATLIESTCIFYPVSLMKEIKTMREMGYNPLVFIHEDAEMTSPFDIAANRADDILGGLQGRSCGVGIWRTRSRDASLNFREVMRRSS